MARFVSCAVCTLILALAGCPPRAAQPVPQQPQLQGAGCPAASGVFLASYVTLDPGKGRTGWVLPLHAMKLDAGAQVADYQAIDDAAAAAAGVPATPVGNLWLVSSAVAPCLVKAGGHYAAKIDGPPASLSYGVELDGCAAPSDPQDDTGVVLVSQDMPAACQFQSPKALVSRLGQMTGPSSWKRPDKDPPIPFEVASLVPPHDCTAPACEKLWAVGEVAVASKPVAWIAAVNWLTVGDPARPCDWKSEHWSGFFVPGPDGSLVKVTDGQDHSLALSAVLVDSTGARALLAEGPGEYATYDLAPGQATLGQHITWMMAPDEDWESIDRLGPACAPPEPAGASAPGASGPSGPPGSAGPPGTQGTPPRDAKPQSPYP